MAVALCAALVVALLWERHRHQTHVDRMLDRHARQVEGLCQRIQAPEVAVAQHAHDTLEAPEGLGYVPPDDDELARQNYQELMGVPA